MYRIVWSQNWRAQEVIERRAIYFGQNETSRDRKWRKTVTSFQTVLLFDWLTLLVFELFRCFIAFRELDLLDRELAAASARHQSLFNPLRGSNFTSQQDSVSMPLSLFLDQEHSTGYPAPYLSNHELMSSSSSNVSSSLDSSPIMSSYNYSRSAPLSPHHRSNEDARKEFGVTRPYSEYHPSNEQRSKSKLSSKLLDVVSISSASLSSASGGSVQSSSTSTTPDKESSSVSSNPSPLPRPSLAAQGSHWFCDSLFIRLYCCAISEFVRHHVAHRTADHLSTSGPSVADRMYENKARSSLYRQRNQRDENWLVNSDSDDGMDERDRRDDHALREQELPPVHLSANNNSLLRGNAVSSGSPHVIPQPPLVQSASPREVAFSSSNTNTQTHTHTRGNTVGVPVTSGVGAIPRNAGDAVYMNAKNSIRALHQMKMK